MARVRLAPRNPQRITATPLVLAEGVAHPDNTGQITVERVDSTVVVSISSLLLAPGTGAVDPIATLPVGYRSARAFVNYFTVAHSPAGNPAAFQRIGLRSDSILWVCQGDGSRIRPTLPLRGQFEFVTPDPWPT